MAWIALRVWFLEGTQPISILFKAERGAAFGRSKKKAAAFFFFSFYHFLILFYQLFIR